MLRNLGYSLLVLVRPCPALPRSHMTVGSTVAASKNAGGEWCCGDYDCKSYTKASSTSTGWMVDGEFVHSTKPWPIRPTDGQVTVCRRPDGTRRCVFGLKPDFRSSAPVSNARQRTAAASRDGTSLTHASPVEHDFAIDRTGANQPRAEFLRDQLRD